MKMTPVEAEGEDKNIGGMYYEVGKLCFSNSSFRNLTKGFTSGMHIF